MHVQRAEKKLYLDPMVNCGANHQGARSCNLKSPKFQELMVGSGLRDFRVCQPGYRERKP